MENERRLIYADTLLETIYDTADGLADCDQQNAAWSLRKYAVREITNAPAVDAVEVVRCRDCRHWNEETGFCNLNSHFSMDGLDWDVFNDDDFCSLGERRTDDKRRSDSE